MQPCLLNNFFSAPTFGSAINSRAFACGEYRFGMNGQEKDDEVKGDGNHLAFGDYGYDTRLGRRWNIDPVEQPDISGYAVFNNNPNFFTDPDGESPISIFSKQVAKKGLKKAAKETVEAMVKSRLKSYMSQKWASQLAKDALDAIDLATSQSWWEYAIEVIPIAGDAYGAYKLSDQAYNVYKITRRFEKIAEVGAKTVAKAWKKVDLDITKLSKGGAEKLQAFATKFNNIGGDHLSPDDLGGAVKDMFGMPVKINGKTYNHLEEVSQSLKDMNTRLAELSGAITKGEFKGNDLKEAQSLYDRVNKQKNEIQGVIDAAKKSAKD
jgi:RHS repeat-associated protein